MSLINGFSYIVALLLIGQPWKVQCTYQEECWSLSGFTLYSYALCPKVIIPEREIIIEYFSMELKRWWKIVTILCFMGRNQSTTVGQHESPLNSLFVAFSRVSTVHWNCIQTKCLARRFSVCLSRSELRAINIMRLERMPF